MAIGRHADIDHRQGHVLLCSSLTQQMVTGRQSPCPGHLLLPALCTRADQPPPLPGPDFPSTCEVTVRQVSLSYGDCEIDEAVWDAVPGERGRPVHASFLMLACARLPSYGPRVSAPPDQLCPILEAPAIPRTWGPRPPPPPRYTGPREYHLGCFVGVGDYPAGSAEHTLIYPSLPRMELGNFS